MDPRKPYCYSPGAAAGGLAEGERGAYGWWGMGRFECLNAVPTTLSTTSMAAAQVPSAGVPLTLVTTSGGGITVGQSITRADTGATVTGLLLIDAAQVPQQNASVGGNIFWAPGTAVARAVSIASVGNDSAATFTVRGFDLYNYPMTETITGSNAVTATGNKAFKYILSITPAGTLSGSNVSAGQSDTYGFFLRIDHFQFATIWWPDTTLVASPTGFTVADTTSPATATTGDVRGTYALQGTASNGVRRLVLYDHVGVGNMGTATGLCGVTQFADF
jgi:hypothetical protein